MTTIFEQKEEISHFWVTRMRRKSSSRALSTFSRRELGSRGSQLPPCCSGLWRFIFVIPRAQGQYIRRTNLDIIIKVTSNILDEPTWGLLTSNTLVGTLAAGNTGTVLGSRERGRLLRRNEADYSGEMRATTPVKWGRLLHRRSY